MIAYLLQTPHKEDTLYWALALSILLHVLMAFILPNMQFEKPSTEHVMTIELFTAQSAARSLLLTPISEPEAVVWPTPIKPMVKPVIQTNPHPLLSRTVKSQQSAETAPDNVPELPTASTQTKTEATPSIINPMTTIEAPRSSVSNPPDTSDARNQYGALLTREIGKYKQYPQIARMRGWEGEVILELQLDGNGNMLNCRIYQSSNRESLDNHALEMVRKASPFPLPPQSLRGRSFTILVPISFKLE